MAFPTTQWLLVRMGRNALPDLFERYRPALKAYLVRSRKLQSSDADDLIQGFVKSQMIEGDLTSRADQTRGRFRTFLLTALNRFVSNVRRHGRSSLRQPAAGPPLSLDSGLDHASSASTQDVDAFDIAWAREILNETIRRMQYRCENTGRLDIWGVFESRLLKPLLEQEPPSNYQELCDRFALESPTQAAYLLATGKRMYLRMLRSVISEYVKDENDIDEEINDLIHIFARPRA